jgi:hypothetical protein
MQQFDANAKPPLSKVSLVVGIPMVGRPVTPEWALSYAALNYPFNMNIVHCPVKGMEVGEARNLIAEQAIKMKAPWLFFMDDDVAPPYHAVRSLMYNMQNWTQHEKVMVVAGIYTSKMPPCEPFVFMEAGGGTYWHWKRGQVFECGLIGTGCMLIRTEVFNYIEKPWFKTVDEVDDGSSRLARTQITDDMYFCQKVTQAGFKILADGDVLPVHWDIKPLLDDEGRIYNWESVPWLMPENSYPMREYDPVVEVIKPEVKEEVPSA